MIGSARRTAKATLLMKRSRWCRTTTIHKDVYKPQVMDSKLITRSENNFLIYLRLLKKKVITVVLDTYHDVHYSKVSATRWRCRSYTTRICEVEHAGGKGEFVLLPDTGY